MSKQEKKKPDDAPVKVEVNVDVEQTDRAETPPAPEQDPVQEKLSEAQTALAAKEDQYLRLLAEYDNFRKRTAKEKESAWAQAKMDTVKAFLPVYDNLARAMKQKTEDEAYAKGVEMTMTGLKNILTKLGVTEIAAQGESFDPNRHNAVMHVEDATVGESIVVEVFETGFALGDKVIRHAMVKVAN